MDDLIIISDFDDDMIDILPPEPKVYAVAEMSSCDCCGICEECLSP
jgi:hypothetical protein